MYTDVRITVTLTGDGDGAIGTSFCGEGRDFLKPKKREKEKEKLNRELSAHFSI
jgi:hypothetical protein